MSIKAEPKVFVLLSTELGYFPNVPGDLPGSVVHGSSSIVSLARI
jgi:hypothetical protein